MLCSFVTIVVITVYILFCTFLSVLLIGFVFVRCCLAERPTRMY